MANFMKNWIPRDSDTFITKDGFVFNVFGYEHPPGRTISYIKYIPSEYTRLFRIRYLKRSWRRGDRILFRAAQLYTTQNYQKLVNSLRLNFPEYLHFSPFHKKEVISPPTSSIENLFEPRRQLNALTERKDHDRLQTHTLRLILLLSTRSGVHLENFGLSGSIALSMHTSESDIDFVVYGSRNFRRVEKSIENLVKDGDLSYIYRNRIDKIRRHKGRYAGRLFNYNGVRTLKEIRNTYGDLTYTPIQPVTCQCRVMNDENSMFRPAIYPITDYQPLTDVSILSEKRNPLEVVSMIGRYRNIARRDERIEVSGVLEEVKHHVTGDIHTRIVVGTGINEDEYLRPIKNGKTTPVSQK